MEYVYLLKGRRREKFVDRIWEELEVNKFLNEKGIERVLIKPNIVSYERYPTTTHPDVVRACLKNLDGYNGKILVADGPAPDAGDTEKIVENHELKNVCDEFGAPLIDLLGAKMLKMKTSRGFKLNISGYYKSFIISLPVLKSHKTAGITGALKNQFGFLAKRERALFHMKFGKRRLKDIHLGITELNTIIKPNLFIVDAIQTLIGANEIRHGGKLRDAGYMLAGKDPVSLDIVGFGILKSLDERLSGMDLEDILHIKHAINIIGKPDFGVIKW